VWPRRGLLDGQLHFFSHFSRAVSLPHHSMFNRSHRVANLLPYLALLLIFTLGFSRRGYRSKRCSSRIFLCSRPNLMSVYQPRRARGSSDRARVALPQSSSGFSPQYQHMIPLLALRARYIFLGYPMISYFKSVSATSSWCPVLIESKASFSTFLSHHYPSKLCLSPLRKCSKLGAHYPRPLMMIVSRLKMSRRDESGGRWISAYCL
jgi:hypothetical protein